MSMIQVAQVFLLLAAFAAGAAIGPFFVTLAWAQSRCADILELTGSDARTPTGDLEFVHPDDEYCGWVLAGAQPILRDIPISERTGTWEFSCLDF